MRLEKPLTVSLVVALGLALTASFIFRDEVVPPPTREPLVPPTVHDDARALRAATPPPPPPARPPPRSLAPNAPPNDAAGPTASTSPPSGVANEREDPWAPPSPRAPVFDLDADGRVGSDERERADEILVLAQQFASNRSADGMFPILRADFRGDRRHFAAMDADGDGALSAREWVAFHVESIHQLRRFDQNHDGALTVAEFGSLESRFMFLDEEQDGLLWAWEIDLQRGLGRW